MFINNAVPSVVTCFVSRFLVNLNDLYAKPKRVFPAKEVPVVGFNI